MASLLKDSRLSTGVLSMRFMQRKAEVELAERLGSGAQESQWHSAGISLPAGANRKGPTIVYDQRRDTGAARSYSRRSFGNFNTIVEATEATEAERDAAEPAVASEQPAKKKPRRDASSPGDGSPATESGTAFRKPADTASPTAAESGDWRRKLEDARRAGDTDNARAATKSETGVSDAVTVGSSKKSKKNKKKKRKMSAT